MRKIYPPQLLTAVAALLLGLFSRIECQAQTNTWTGTDPATAAAATDNDEKTVFLYNVSTGKFLNRGGTWGVAAVLSNIGAEFTIEGDATKGYSFKGKLMSEKGGSQYEEKDAYITMATDNGYQCWMDRSKDDSFNQKFGNTFTVEAVEGQTTTYHLKVTKNSETRYLAAGNSSSYSVVDATTAITGYTTLPKTGADWKIVTLKERKQAFMKAEANLKNNVGATFLLKCGDFSRRSSDITSWTLGETALTYATAASEGTTVTPSNQTKSFYMGIGKADSQDESWKWTGNIKGTNGDLHQTVTPFKHGWYEVRCHAFSTTSTGTPVLYAKVGDATSSSTGNVYTESAIQKLSSEKVPTSYINGHDLVNGTSTADGKTYYPYEVVARVYVGKSENSEGSEDSETSDNKDTYETCPTLTFGVKTGSGAEADWLCVDNFELEYLGEGDNIVLLDETQTSVDYINAQAEGKNSTIYLNRSLTANKWNSLLIPFDMTQQDINSIFGSGTIVSEYKGAKSDNANTIVFEKVTEIKAGKLYIIKPTTGEPTNQAAVASSKKNDSNESVLSFNENSSYYTIPNVVFGNNGEENSQFTATVQEDAKDFSYNDKKYRFAGTYVKKQKTTENPNGYAAPAYSFMVLAASKDEHTGSKGVWTLRAKTTNSLGFRGWLEPVSAEDGQNASAKISFIINGVEDETTGIDGITADSIERPAVNGIYTISGQRVNGELQSLPRGLYIVNGKKVVVK